MCVCVYACHFLCVCMSFVCLSVIQLIMNINLKFVCLFFAFLFVRGVSLCCAVNLIEIRA